MDDAEAGESPPAADARLLLRPLLPAVARPPKKRPATPSTRDGSDEPVAARRRQQISIACDACRTRKCKCDGAKPKCGRCRKRNLVCIFQEPTKDALRRRLDELKDTDSATLDIFRALQARPETEAVDIFRRIRAGVDPASIMRQISAADIMLQVQLKPESRFRYDFPYRAAMPLVLQTPDNPYLQSIIYERSYVGGPPQLKAAPSSNPSTPPSPENVDDHRLNAQYLAPFHSATVVDPRLGAVTPSKWTTVSADDALLRDLLRAFFLHEYDYFKPFQKDAFLDDMLRGHGPLCSSLLVNCVLAVGSHTHGTLAHRAEYWNPHTLGYQFLAEAKRLWEIDISSGPTITTLQAALVMQLLLNISGMDKVGRMYGRQITGIARELGLFGYLTHIEDPRLLQAHQFMAWSLFCLQGIVDFAFRSKPTYMKPPKCTLPDAAQDPGWYGEIWIQYHDSDMLTPLHCGALFSARVGLVSVLHELMVKLDWRDPLNVGRDHATLVIDALWKLKDWYQRLPEPLTPRKIATPGQLKLHLHYYEIVTWLYELLVIEAEAGRAPANVDVGNLKRAVFEAESYTETILRLYYLRHGFEKGDMMLCHFVTRFAFSTLAKLEAIAPNVVVNASPPAASAPSPPSPDAGAFDLEDVRSALVLAERGLSDQGHSFFFPQTMFHLIQARLAPDEARIVSQHAHVPGEDPDAQSLRAMHLHSNYPVRDNTADAPLSDYMTKYADEDRSSRESS
ncbi:hypothetical protein F5X68DRAFT_218053 [Plectosphaerella plurivora]|uniref:Zn(2)-C6 fungal-type domain-containing protein n=1 Tax=Plectosphaerella plurivora TaxID=936078 RepID=A0A9P8V1Y6_9PEZI|nr:hypothetical protein F5X68DRAFT_218053 [Plectosphaerella plurivora]